MFSCLPLLHMHRSKISLATPCLALSALDDPVCSHKGIPRDTRLAAGSTERTVECHMLGPGLVTAVTASGGHVAFGEGSLLRGGMCRSYMERVGYEWLHACLSEECD